MRSTRAIGAGYERLACHLLRDKGYTIQTTNFTIRGGELDIVAKKDGVMVFVEVRYRADDSFGNPIETVGQTKIRRICRTAQYYMVSNGYPTDTPVRFDVITITGTDIEHIENAFDFQP